MSIIEDLLSTTGLLSHLESQAMSGVSSGLQESASVSVDPPKQPLFLKCPLSSRHAITTLRVNKQNQEGVGHINNAPSKKRRQGNEEATDCQELVLYTVGCPVIWSYLFNLSLVGLQQELKPRQ